MEGQQVGGGSRKTVNVNARRISPEVILVLDDHDIALVGDAKEQNIGGCHGGPDSSGRATVRMARGIGSRSYGVRDGKKCPVL